mmetsp:Transcript_14351/g.42085  ORF Transcript_14351/g.42085 Transcript_14351/m.42085 type:complete len:218 (+) Transcript_14351:48-701(+)
MSILATKINTFSINFPPIRSGAPFSNGVAPSPRRILPANFVFLVGREYLVARLPPDHPKPVTVRHAFVGPIWVVCLLVVKGFCVGGLPSCHPPYAVEVVAGYTVHFPFNFLLLHGNLPHHGHLLLSLLLLLGNCLDCSCVLVVYHGIPPVVASLDLDIVFLLLLVPFNLTRCHIVFVLIAPATAVAPTATVASPQTFRSLHGFVLVVLLLCVNGHPA